MLGLEAALERVVGGVTPLAVEEVPLADAADRWAAAGLFARTDLPPFDNSAMDGYAVRAAGLETASPQAPVTLRCTGRTAAGVGPGPELAGGTCQRIFTGAPLPPGADAVVMQEDTRLDPAAADHVQICDAVRPWEHVRFRGEDVKAGAQLAAAGDCLNFARLALLAAAGCDRVAVHRRPTVGLLATGDELVEPGMPLTPGAIYESNRLMVQALVRQTSCETKLFPLVQDLPERTRAALERAFTDCDVVITSGGVSVGEHDHVRPAFEALGGRLEFWQVAMRPGKPFVWGTLGRRHLFGLPGNPVSAAVTFLLLVRPALIRLQGGRNHRLPQSPGVLAEEIHNPSDRRHFVRVTLDAARRVAPVGRQGSHVLSGLAGADALLDVPPATRWPAGQAVEVLLFP